MSRFSSIADKKYEFDTLHKIYCKCGEYGVVFYTKDKDRLICKNCGCFIYRNKETEFKYKMKERGMNIK